VYYETAVSSSAEILDKSSARQAEIFAHCKEVGSVYSCSTLKDVSPFTTVLPWSTGPCSVNAFQWQLAVCCEIKPGRILKLR